MFTFSNIMKIVFVIGLAVAPSGCPGSKGGPTKLRPVDAMVEVTTPNTTSEFVS